MEAGLGKGQEPGMQKLSPAQLQVHPCCPKTQLNGGTEISKPAGGIRVKFFLSAEMQPKSDSLDMNRCKSGNSWNSHMGNVLTNGGPGQALLGFEGMLLHNPGTGILRHAGIGP